ncbi:TenA family protein [Maribellus maritimus]|uniref:TenA family protein n=1 Tax=Maribellus maritimus TaxID=2870838 RepID=UPI001EEC1236|nr:TenA family protein [Maribellus maritimus]MCG6191040.1 TenA family protein [Maribellus maritimus]
MKWSDKAWNECASVYNKILKLPFLNELMNGTLPQEKFQFYLQQDAIYLAEYGKILAGIAAKLNRKEWREDFLKFSSDTVSVEQALHEYYLKNSDRDIDATPTCALYTGHMYRQLACASTEEALAAILPCFWVYKKVGDYILENQTKIENPYQPWIDTYGGDDFALAVQKAITICDKAANETTPALRESMTQAFKLSFKMEWMFWDSAWRLEQWPV